MLGKLVWDMHCNFDKLWVQMLTHKYVKEGSFLGTSLHYGSPIWNSIFKAKEELKEGYVFRVGNGESLFWYSPWSSFGLLCDHVFAVAIQDASLQIKDICINNQWQLHNLATQLPDHVKTSLQNTCLFLNPNVHDNYIWGGTTDGVYTAKAGFQWLQSKKGGGDITLNWSSIWKIPGPEKLCFLIWLAWHDSLPTMQSLQKRGVVQSPFCTRCIAGVEETVLHCLRDCNLPRQLWQQLGMDEPIFFQYDNFVSWQLGALEGISASLFLAGMWTSWCTRNAKCLGGEDILVHKSRQSRQ